VIRVAVVDDHQLFRLAIQTILKSDPHFLLVGEYPDSSILEQLSTIKPDVIVCDLSLLRESGITLIKEITASYPQIGILVMSMHKDEFHILRAIENGARGYLYKDDSPTEVVLALKKVSSGATYYSSPVAAVLNNSSVSKLNHNTKKLLTRKEREVIHYILEGLTSKEIGDKLGISTRTIETHRYNVLNKLGLKSSAELIKRFTEQGI
jgi:DNA-binding NarL/FixJ family response regulator